MINATEATILKGLMFDASDSGVHLHTFRASDKDVAKAYDSLNAAGVVRVLTCSANDAEGTITVECELANNGM